MGRGLPGGEESKGIEGKEESRQLDLGALLGWVELLAARKCVQGEVADEAGAASQALRELPWSRA